MNRGTPALKCHIQELDIEQQLTAECSHRGARRRTSARLDWDHYDQGEDDAHPEH